MPLSTAPFVETTWPHLPRLRRLGLRMARHPNDAEDLVQEVLCRAWASWDRFDAGGNVGAYLSRILVNTFISRHRHRRVVIETATRPDLHEHLTDPRKRAEASDPERSWQGRGLSDEVVQALDALPTRYREVVELVDLGGLAYRDAANTLGVPLGTVMSRLHRARRILRDHLADFAREAGLAAAPAPAAA